WAEAERAAILLLGAGGRREIADNREGARRVRWCRRTESLFCTVLWRRRVRVVFREQSALQRHVPLDEVGYANRKLQTEVSGLGACVERLPARVVCEPSHPGRRTDGWRIGLERRVERRERRHLCRHVAA